jgi:hypothetical protein
MLPIDDLPPARSYSIREFVAQAAALHGSDDKTDFIRFVLTGQWDGHQVVIDPLRHVLEAQERLTIKRDFDSLLGLSREICVLAPLFVYPVARHEDTLRHNVHIRRPIHRESVSFTAYVGLL